MIKNYFKIAFRGFWKHKLFTLINIIGLSIGISAALVIYLIVHFDFTFDKFHKDGDRVYRVVSHYVFSGEQAYNRGVCGPLPAAVKSQVTGVEVTAPFYSIGQVKVSIPSSGDKGNAVVKFKRVDNIILADAQYFKLFSYTWLAGSAQNALNEPNQLVLTSDQAKKYFPALRYDQMIGKIVNYDTIKTVVTGIVQTIEQNTDFAFHDFISYSTGLANKSLKDQLGLTNWGGTGSSSQLFIRLSPNTAPARVEKQLNTILAKNNPPTPDTKGDSSDLRLQPLSDLHFNPNYGTFNNGRTANKTTLYQLMVIALFILLLGCINFINLTTAQATQRAKEIGIRKTLGSSRKQLVVQFLSETVLITFFAVIVSWFLAIIILKLFAGFIPEGVSANLFRQPGILVFLCALTIVVSLLSGFYPAILLSGYKPVQVLKSQSQTNSGQSRNAWLRKSLTVTQFVVAQFFIMTTILVSKQIYYALHKDVGFKKDAIILMYPPYGSKYASSNRVFFNQLRAIPQVELVSIGHDAPSSYNINSTEATYKEGKKEVKTIVQQKFADENYLKLYKIKVLAGRDVEPSDTAKSILINSTYAKELGFNNPREAVGKYLDDFNDKKNVEIVGVVADFHQTSLRWAIKPLAILASADPNNNDVFQVALKPQTANGGEWKKAFASMEKSWKTLYPDADFAYYFFDESIAQFYNDDRQTSKLLSWATGLSIFISCLGLLGLAIYTTGQRTKEIGVRKVLGATVAQMVILLSRELVALIMLAFVIASPLAWWAMHTWIQGFADHTSISWWIFAACCTGMLFIALFTSGFQTVKAARANPVKSLRSE